MRLKPGTVMPKAMDSTAPSDAPEATPIVEPSARGFRNRPCIAAPHRDSEAPTSAADSTRGRRMVMMMDCVMPPAGSVPNRPLETARNTVRTGTATLPADTQTTSVTSVASEKNRYCMGLKPSCRKEEDWFMRLLKK